ncbi:hypothetical protein FEM48_Zijuj08G0195500 [Ziziphus jujuba var. spinosa]|uniref:Uncharacterized protein n=1 Tax=Ziziphus jujuba var. spinosa TaxID=714518 RepID=A0A978V0Z1_ZIZJJ|nr:hypothetical protein FEM48_Zijuj08G0195500 [Ziziphus jujuba var. spinosa]
MRKNHGIEHSEIKNIVDSGSLSLPAFIATAGTTLIIGFVPNSLLLLHIALHNDKVRTQIKHSEPPFWLLTLALFYLLFTELQVWLRLARWKVVCTQTNQKGANEIYGANKTKSWQVLGKVKPRRGRNSCSLEGH